MNRVTNVAGMEVMSEFSTMDFQGWSGYNHCWMPSVPAKETNSESPVWHYSLGWLLATWWKVGHIGPLLSWKRAYVVITSIDTHIGCRFSFLAHNASAQTTIMESQNILFTIMKSQIALLLTKEHVLWPKKWAVYSCLWYSLVLPYSSLSRTDWIDRKMKKSLLKA